MYNKVIMHLVNTCDLTIHSDARISFIRWIFTLSISTKWQFISLCYQNNNQVIDFLTHLLCLHENINCPLKILRHFRLLIQKEAFNTFLFLCLFRSALVRTSPLAYAIILHGKWVTTEMTEFNPWKLQRFDYRWTHFPWE